MNSKTAHRERMLSVRETAQVLGLCLDSVRRHLRSGKMPGVRVGRNWRIPESQLSVYMGIAKDEEQTFHSAKFDRSGHELSDSSRVSDKALYYRDGSRASTRGAVKTEARNGQDSNEVVEALLRTHPARARIMSLVKEAASGADFAPDDAQHLLRELNELLHEL
ncbi:DNA-binding protein [bacterium]|nr:MAG: DNA-binding protein [bacterium]